MAPIRLILYTSKHLSKARFSGSSAFWRTKLFHPPFHCVILMAKFHYASLFPEAATPIGVPGSIAVLARSRVPIQPSVASNNSRRWNQSLGKQCLQKRELFNCSPGLTS